MKMFLRKVWPSTLECKFKGSTPSFVESCQKSASTHKLRTAWPSTPDLAQSRIWGTCLFSSLSSVSVPVKWGQSSISRLVVKVAACTAHTFGALNRPASLPEASPFLQSLCRLSPPPINVKTPEPIVWASARAVPSAQRNPSLPV